MQINGAKWWKFDFHTHTPASEDYGKENKELKYLTPREWLLEFMNKKIDCIAVTDHNTGAWIDILKLELTRMKEECMKEYRPLYIFPGIEITVSGGIHLLAIFDTTRTSEDIASIIGEVKYRGTRGDNDGCTELTFRQVVSEIIKNGGIPIPSHVDIESGLLIEQEGITLESSLNSKGLLAIELCNLSFIKPQLYKDLKLDFSEVIGSDCHKPEHVGRAYTWVKMQDPDINALWLALHDGEDGIARYDKCSENPNDTHKRFFIKNLIIRDGAKIGRGSEFDVQFSPWMSTIIGGRGSGKSSLLNYMRVVFGGKGKLTSTLKKEFEEFEKIVNGREQTGMLLNNTEIRIELWKDGRDIALVWRSGKVFEEHLNAVTNEWISIGESASIDQRFPIRMFSQKELYEITKEPYVLLHLIDQQFNKLEIDRQLDQLKNQYLNSRNEERKISQLLNNKTNNLVDLDDTKAKLSVFEESDSKKVLEDFKTMQQIENNISEIYNVFAKNIEVLSTTNQSIVPLELHADTANVLDSDSIVRIDDIIKKSNEIREKIINQNNALIEIEKEWKSTIEELPWNNYKNDVQSKYDGFIKKLEEKGEKNPNIYQELIEKKYDLENKIKDVERDEMLFDTQYKNSCQIYEKIIHIQKQIRNMRQEIIRKWNQSNKSIQLNLEIMGDLKRSEEEFRTLIRKPGNEYAKDILEIDEDENPTGGFLYELFKQENDNKFDYRHEFVNNLYLIAENDTRGYGKFFVKHIEVIRSKTAEDIDRLSIWFPEDRITLKLIENGKLSDIETGSAGQRTAAILTLILSLDDSPLIIDQPEDDLDTKRITDLVVTGFRGLKCKQQVIVVTHNPNIPVNGGAEQIIHLGFIKGLIRVQTIGALQRRDVRHAVCEVMEGGRVALNNRYYRISKALEE